ncbi:hypothetical protein AWC22_17685 [Mycobacterium riyadhense]|uniref:Uncharacterized protein n=1 Tax=Mycobacterium riyadhense TaxID=486698 RepID=A0A1X2CY64_9MYCO|nr:hypothetical protein [Mycobacterium riyadhense]ORW80788.1 hypothetical protein AWC22_17685 [Mycobacterium riyadhense]
MFERPLIGNGADGTAPGQAGVPGGILYGNGGNGAAGVNATDRSRRHRAHRRVTARVAVAADAPRY